VFMTQAEAERDALRIENERLREENEELRGENEDLRRYLCRLQDHQIRLLAEMERRAGRPRKTKTDISKRHERRLRAKKGSLRDLLLSLDLPPLEDPPPAPRKKRT
jgi:predicted nuclease with TOPRIM domain